MRNQPRNSLGLQALARRLHALAHPVRLKMLMGLCGQECNVEALWRSLKISQPLASQHLRLLQQTGWVVGVRRGQCICYQMQNPQDIKFLRRLCRLPDKKKSR